MSVYAGTGPEECAYEGRTLSFDFSLQELQASKACSSYASKSLKVMPLLPHIPGRRIQSSTKHQLTTLAMAWER